MFWFTGNQTNSYQVQYNVILAISVATVISLVAFLTMFAYKNNKCKKHSQRKAQFKPRLSKPVHVDSIIKKKNTTHSSLQSTLTSSSNTNKHMNNYKLTYNLSKQINIDSRWSDSESSSNSRPYAKIVSVWKILI